MIQQLTLGEQQDGQKQPEALTVSQFVDLTRDYLSGFGEVVVQGEVSNTRLLRERHLLYFELKDEDARVLCFALTHDVKTTIEDGMEVRVLGEPTLFKKNAGFHLRAKAIELVGQGALQLALEHLKKQLEKEGLFATDRKRIPPRFPSVIGLVTSRDAAAYTDVLRVAKNRWPIHLKLFPAQVQGVRAARSLIRALTAANADPDIEAIILTRGGGSLEDLQAFNSEELARAVFASRVPVVCGVGHERDWTIADLVADVRAATPSNAAELLLPDHQKVVADLAAMQHRLIVHVEHRVEHEQQAIEGTFRRLTHALQQRVSTMQSLVSRFLGVTGRVGERLTQRRQLVDQLRVRLTRAEDQRLVSLREHLTALERLAHNLSPHTLLAKGYSIVFKDGHVVKSTTALAPGDEVRLRLADGRASSIIQETTHD